MKRGISSSIAVAVALAITVGTAAASGGAERAPELTLRWTAPTPADGKSYVVQAGTSISVPLAASAGTEIAARGLPRGGAVVKTAGGTVLNWTPTASTLGAHAVVITAKKPGTNTYAAPRTLFLYGVPAPTVTTASVSDVTQLSAPGVSRWAWVYNTSLVRTGPSMSARPIARLHLFTLDGTPDLAMILAATKDSKGRTWYQIRWAHRPNNQLGWVLAGALGDQHVVKTYLVVDRALLVATLYRGSRPVFRTRIGAGRKYWPTPRGDFFVREVLTGIHDPMYGPVAFGTSALSDVLTDWHGGGGVVGIHGTNLPQILPGHVSHGCIRMPNSQIRKLYRLMPIGTPVAIR